jgi:hypothetical protein
VNKYKLLYLSRLMTLQVSNVAFLLGLNKSSTITTQMYASGYGVHQATLQNATNQIKKIPTYLLEHKRGAMTTVIPNSYILGPQCREGSLCT